MPMWCPFNGMLIMASWPSVLSNNIIFTKGPLIFIICKLIDVEFFCNNKGLLDTQYKEYTIWCFSKQIENLNLFDVHESFMTCKCDTM
jgi:hypothetical protein